MTYSTIWQFEKTLGWFEDPFLSENYYTRLLWISRKVVCSGDVLNGVTDIKKRDLGLVFGSVRMFKEWIGISCVPGADVLECAAMYMKYTQEYKYTRCKGEAISVTFPCNIASNFDALGETMGISWTEGTKQFRDSGRRNTWSDRMQKPEMLRNKIDATGIIREVSRMVEICLGILASHSLLCKVLPAARSRVRLLLPCTCFLG